MADGGYIHLPEDEVCPWEVASGINDGYPYIADYPPPAAYSPANAPTIWALDSAYDGYPYIRPNGLPGAINPDTAGSPWNLHPEINLGYPYIRAVEPVPPEPVVVVPHLTAFIVDGMGADFCRICEETELAIPEEVTIRLGTSRDLYFDFSVKGVM